MPPIAPFIASERSIRSKASCAPFVASSSCFACFVRSQRTARMRFGGESMVLGTLSQSQTGRSSVCEATRETGLSHAHQMPACGVWECMVVYNVALPLRSQISLAASSTAFAPGGRTRFPNADRRRQRPRPMRSCSASVRDGPSEWLIQLAVVCIVTRCADEDR